LRLERALDLDLAVRGPDGRGSRLHRGARKMGNVVVGAKLLGGTRDGRIVVTVIAHDGPGLAGRLLERRLVRHRVVRAVGPVFPHDLERVPTLDGRIRVRGDDGDTAQRIELDRRRAGLDLHDPDHARDLERLGGVEARDGATEHRWPRHYRVEHAVEPRVDAVLRLARHDVLAIDQLQLALADVAELRWILESHGLPRRHRLVRRRGRERSGPEAPTGRLVHDFVVLRLDFAHRNLPAGGRGGFEHHARRGAALAHRLQEMPRAA